MKRFDGCVERLGPVDVSAMLAWIMAIPFKEWPQQYPIDDQLRPAMVNDPDWHDFRVHGLGPVSEAIRLLDRDTNWTTTNWMLSVVMPGHRIDWHRDLQGPDWLGRVHIPLTTNSKASMGFAEGLWHLEVGAAYLVNTERRHAIFNFGETPRIHFMADLIS